MCTKKVNFYCKPKALRFLTLSLVIAISACNGGGGGGAGDGGSNVNPSGGDGGLTIQSVGTLSGLTSNYNPSCIYRYGSDVVLINGDGSGTGFSLSLSSGKLSVASNLPNINLAAGDKCLPSLFQLTWVNSATPTVVHFFDPDRKLTSAFDFSPTGLTGTDISDASFSWGTRIGDIISNNNFSHSNTFGISRFYISNSTLSSYYLIDNSLYQNRDTSRVLYGFWGEGDGFLQLIPTTGNQPAALLTFTQSPLTQKLSTITDSNNQAIGAMSTAWDFSNGGNGVIITTGAVQPVIYRCPLVAAYSFQCNKTYTGKELTSKYRIMRLLGGSVDYVYFIGMDLTKATIEVFSLKL